MRQIARVAFLLIEVGMNKNTGGTPAQQKDGEVERDNDALRSDPQRSEGDKTTAQRIGKREGKVDPGKPDPV